LNNSFELDFRKNGKLSVDDSKLIDKIAPIVLRDYNDFTGRFIKTNKLTGLSLLLASTCRNMAMAGSLDDRYFANSMDILTINAKTLYKSREIAAIWARISTCCTNRSFHC
jgi:hypothetical protein